MQARPIVGLLAVLLLGGTAHGGGPASALVGKWRGSYTCRQGHTGLLLTVSESKDLAFAGEFAFYPAADNPRVPKGRYAITGNFNPQTFRIDIKGEHWIEQPTNYLMVDLHGVLSEDGSAIDGKVEFSGCTSFHLALEGAPRHAPKPKDANRS